LIDQSIIGKFPLDLIEKIVYPRLGAHRPEILVGPGHGRDNAVIRLGHNQVLVATADPLSMIPALGGQDSAWLSVNLLASDLATCGFPPQFMIVNLCLPPSMSDNEFEEYWSAFHNECKKLGIAILGGHTGRYVAYGSAFLKRAQSYFHQFSVVEDALTAASAGLRDEGVTAMHDVTEGGLLGALYELSEASKIGLEIELSDVIVTEEAKLVCDLFNIDPYSTLSEGTLIISVKPEKAQKVLQALKLKRVKSEVIGKVTDLRDGRWVKRNGVREALKKPSVDPYWEAYWKAYQKGLK